MLAPHQERKQQAYTSLPTFHLRLYERRHSDQFRVTQGTSQVIFLYLNHSITLAVQETHAG